MTLTVQSDGFCILSGSNSLHNILSSSANGSEDSEESFKELTVDSCKFYFAIVDESTVVQPTHSVEDVERA